MNRHELVDAVTIAASAVALRNARFFARSVESPAIREAVSGSRLSPDSIRPEGISEVVAATPVGGFRGAYLAWNWVAPDAPTLIFHHGSGEDPFDFGRFSANSVRRLFTAEGLDAINLIAVRAPFHDRSSREYARAMGELTNFAGMLATSTAIVDALTTALRERGCPTVLVSGISLGGWVTNLHRAFVGGADRYVPIFAGAALGEVFATSTYRRMTGESARARPRRLRETLNFERVFVESGADCSPLLARYDRIVEFETQRPCYRGTPLAVIEKGHVTGSLATAALRDHLRTAVERTVTPERGPDTVADR
ncbi:MAG: hypothetical protein ABEJ28_04465 [Salinigranum sp.]